MANSNPANNTAATLVPKEKKKKNKDKLAPGAQQAMNPAASSAPVKTKKLAENEGERLPRKGT